MGVAAPHGVEGTFVLFGNSRPHMLVKREERVVAVPHPYLKQSVTSMEMWQGFDDSDTVELTLSTDNDRKLLGVAALLGDEHRKYAIGVHEVEQMFQTHSGGAKPDWVDSNDEGFARALAHYYGCHLGQPVATVVNVGRDAVHQQVFTTGTQPAAFTYLALSASTGAITTGDTTLPGEITTTGLARAQGSVAHTTGTNVTTVTKTFTAVGADVAGGAVVVSQVSVFNAAGPPVAGTMWSRSSLSSTATLTVAGDNVTVTETANIG